MRSKRIWLCPAVFLLIIVASTQIVFCRPLAGKPAVGGFLLAGQNPSGQNPAAEDSVANQEMKTKNPTGALIRSALIPGWGQLYNEKRIKSGLVVTVEGLLVAGAIVEHQRADDDYNIYQNPSQPDEVREAAWRRYSRRIDKRNTYLWYLAGARFLSMIDAYVDAHLYRFDEGPFAFDVRQRQDEYCGVVVMVRCELR